MLCRLYYSRDTLVGCGVLNHGMVFYNMVEVVSCFDKGLCSVLCTEIFSGTYW